MFLTFDLETAKLAQDVGGWEQLKGPNGGGLSCACTIATGNGQDVARVWDQWTREALANYIENFPGTLVTFNGMNFDLPLLSAQVGRPIIHPHHVDLLQVVWEALGKKRGGYGLGPICERTLGRGKTGDGIHASELFREGRHGELIQYCLDDCYLTRDLYLHIWRHGTIIGVDGDEISLPRTLYAHVP